MQEQELLLVDKRVLPEIIPKVLAVKEQLQSGGQRSVSLACAAAGISRGAYYKYKDYVFAYNKEYAGRMMTVHATLLDRAGILSHFMSVLYQNGANILTVNQNIPIGGRAQVSVSFRTGRLQIPVTELLKQLRQLEGLVSIEQVSGD